MARQSTNLQDLTPYWTREKALDATGRSMTKWPCSDLGPKVHSQLYWERMCCGRESRTACLPCQSWKGKRNGYLAKLVKRDQQSRPVWRLRFNDSYMGVHSSRASSPGWRARRPDATCSCTTSSVLPTRHRISHRAGTDQILHEGADYLLPLGLGDVDGDRFLVAVEVAYLGGIPAL